MIEKGKSIYRVEGKTIRILDRKHLSKYLDNRRGNVSNNIKSEVLTYARHHPGKVKFVSS